MIRYERVKFMVFNVTLKQYLRYIVTVGFIGGGPAVASN